MKYWGFIQSLDAINKDRSQNQDGSTLEIWTKVYYELHWLHVQEITLNHTGLKVSMRHENMHCGICAVMCI